MPWVPVSRSTARAGASSAGTAAASARRCLGVSVDRAGFGTAALARHGRVGGLPGQALTVARVPR